MTQNKRIWVWFHAEELKTELMQLEDEGRVISPALRRRFEKLMGMGDAFLHADNQLKVAALLEDVQKLPVRRDYPFREPSELADIRKLRPRGPRKYAKRLPDKILLDHITGGWQGRCVGCFLGKPVEGVDSASQWSFLKATGQWPLRRYMRLRAPGKPSPTHKKMIARLWYDKTNWMPVDDDTNYTTTGLLMVKKHGADFTPRNAAEYLCSALAYNATYTAEHAAYRNIVMGIRPPASATFLNPYREWIGAQIRADSLGYLNIGNPQRAADFAWRDASISHTRNGIYGEMWVAAMIAAAPYCADVLDLIRVGLSEVPKSSRFHAAIEEVIAWRREGITYDEAVRRIHQKWDENMGHHWCHVLSNASVCAVALLWGEGDFSRSICYAVQACFDTDCNGATVGSILGTMLGTRGIPSRWTSRLHDRLRTSIPGYSEVPITQMARETFELHKAIRK